MLYHIILLKYFILFIGYMQVSSQDSTEVSERILNGRDVKPGGRPFQVSLQDPKHFCGGTIISNRYVITAAHCLVGKRASNINIAVGTVDLRKPFKKYRGKRIIIHRSYAPSNSYINDIALLQVSKPIQYSYRVKAAPITTPNTRLTAGTPVIVSGWGILDNGSLANVLQEVLLEVTNQNKCRRAVRKEGFNLYSTQMCADDNDPGVRSGDCNGDSGGPLTANGVLVGVVSWSIKDPSCGSNEYPNVYTRVSRYVSWILTNIKRTPL